MRTRVITAVAVMPVVLVALFSTSVWPLIVIGGLCVIWGSSELAALAGLSFPPILGMALYIDAVAMIGLSLVGFDLAAGALFALTILGAMGAQRLFVKGQNSASLSGSEKARDGVVRSRIALEVASLWVAAPASSIPLVHIATYQGASVPWGFKSLALLILLPLWSGDIAAILVGSKWGKHPLMPLISPKKTVEGSVANLIASIAAAAALADPLRVPLLTAIMCGAAIGILGQVGDLFESALKRSVGVKDSGTIFPGHGGMLDRIDSLLFAAPAVAAILLLAR